MRKPPIPANDLQRVAALKSYEILDTAPDPEFDNLTRLASLICQTPISLISLVDENRQWFKSDVGLGVPETSRDVSFCAHAIELADPLIIQDARQDERFADNPLVVGSPFIRFYAGVPLRDPNGFSLGTLCVIDSKPRKLSVEQMATLTVLASQVVTHIRLRYELQKKEQVLSAYREKERQLSNFFDSAPLLMGLVHLQNGMLLEGFDSRATRMLVERLSQGARHTLLSDLSADALALWVSKCVEAIATKQSIRFIYSHGRQEVRTLKVVLKYSGDHGEGVQQFCYFAEDLTESLKTQMLLTKSAKMASVGEMTSGIAHEINNPMSVIHGKAGILKQLLKQDKLTPERMAVELDKIEETALRVSKIVKGIRAFSGNTEAETFARVKLSSIITDALDLADERFKRKGIDIQFGEIPDVEVECRSLQISQILLNLLNNAHDAVEPLEDKWVRIECRVEDDQVEIAVSDSGPKIPKAIARHMMEPFFTTKGVNVGSGLGLSIAQSISKAHNGALMYDGTHHFTRFILQIPLSQKPARKSAA